MTRATDFIAVFSADSENAVVFMDTNTLLLDVQYTSNEPVVDRVYDYYAENFGGEWPYVSGVNAEVTTVTIDDADTWMGFDEIDWRFWRGGVEPGTFAIDGGGVFQDTTPGGNLSWFEVTIPGGFECFSFNYRKGSTQGGGPNASGGFTLTIIIDGDDDIVYSDLPMPGTGTDNTVFSFSEDTLDITDDVTIRVDVDGSAMVFGNFTFARGANVSCGDIRDENRALKTDRLAVAPNPHKPGLTVRRDNNYVDKWNLPLDNIVTDTVIYLQYIIDTTASLNLTVNNAEGSGTYGYNDVVTLSPDSEQGEFSYWEIDGSIVSYNNLYRFTLLADKTVDAVYDVEEFDIDPLITITGPLQLRPLHNSYIGQFYIPSGYRLIEYGILTTDTDIGEFDLSNATVYPGFKFFGLTREYLMTFATPHERARAYLIVEYHDGQGWVFTTILSDIVNAVDFEQ